MKKIFTLCVVLCLSYLSMGATNPKHEFRATWLTTAWGNDWPKTKVTNATTRKQQQDSLIAIFDRLQAGNMNAVCFQVRGRSDAFYQSSYEPWAAELAGARGKDPGYDPLAFAIEEAHKRGLELHAWVNPFRVTSSGTLSTSDKVWLNAGQWIIQYNNGSFSGQIIDPGYPEAREYVLNVLMEIISNYDIDGIVMDDYFYPYGGTTTEDAASKALHKPVNVVDVNQDGDTDDDWRRSNVDVFLEELYDRIQAKKPWVRFGMGTFGIWTTQSKVAQAYGISLPSGISGLDDYDEQACNPVEWVKNGYVDYINPQLYWPTTSTGQNYNKLCQWWAKDVCEHFSDQLTNGKKVHFFSSQSISANPTLTEIQSEIDVNRNNLSSGSTGSVFFDTDAYLTMDKDLMTSRFATNALTPPMDWKSKTALSAPTNLTISGTTLTWKHATAERFTVYVYPKGTAWSTAKNDPAYLQGVIYGNSLDISGIDTNMNDIAVCAYDRFGVEHTAAVYSNDSGAGTTPNPETIIWELNGGEVNTVTVEVPSLTTLEAQFKNDYNSYFGASVATTREITNFLYYGSKEEGGSNLVYNMMNDPASDWTWLRDYIISKSASNTTIQTALLAGTDAHWRYSIVAFLTASAGTNSTYTVDFSTAGQPSKWGTAYQIAHGAVLLPTYVTSAFTLPIPTHPQGHDFLGWYDNAEFIGSPLTTISADWTGSLYAKWHIIDPTWQITYTSSNDSIVTPYATDVFGANIVSNTYENGVGTITFDGPVTSIGNSAFRYCSSLISITIPNSVMSIGNRALSHCTSLTSITIPNSVTSIGFGAFDRCSLISITIPNSVTSIGEIAFRASEFLESIFVESGNTTYDSRENCNAIIETATNTLILGCQNTVIPNSVTSVGDYAFRNCSSMTSIEIPNSVTSIGKNAFSDCSSLASIIIPNSVESIGYRAFYSCSSLTSITVPNSVTSIGNSAFLDCSNLTVITIPNSVTSIEERVFSYCKSIESIVVESGNTTYDSRNNCNAIIETATNTLISGCQNTIIPNSVTSIGNSAFEGCKFTSITIPNNVISIVDWSFAACDSLATVTIGNSVRSIGVYAFRDCSSLDTIYVKATVPPMLGDMAFEGSPSPVCVIPCGTLAAYEASDWANYMGRFVEECTDPASAVTFDADVDKGNAVTDSNNAAAYQISKNGVTLDVSSGMLGTYNNEMHYRIFKNNSITVTSVGRNITKIEFICTANDNEQYGPGWFVVDDGNYAYSGVVGTWIGDAPSVTFTTSAYQVRATQIIVTLVDEEQRITYKQNGGITNDYGWTSKGAIALDLQADYNAAYGTSKAWAKAENGYIYYKIGTDWVREDLIPEGTDCTVTGFMQNVTYNTTDNLKKLINDNEKYTWLKDVIITSRTAAGLDVTDANLSETVYRKELSAFFLCSPATSSWPASSSYETAGQYEFFKTIWRHAFANPTNPTEEFVLNAPYREGYTFAGWYTTPNFSGGKIETIDVTTAGTLYAKWSTPQFVIFDADVDKGNAGIDSNNATAYQIYKNGVTLDVTSGILGTYNNEYHYRIYKNSSITISSIVGNIAKIEFRCTANNDESYGPGCFTVDGGDYTYSDAVGTWTGDAAIVTFNASANQVRATQIEVTLVDKLLQEKGITYELNGGLPNEYGWQNKNDMFQACMADCGVTTLPSLDEIKATGNDAALTTICTKLTDVSGMLNSDKWEWLEQYIMEVQNAQVGNVVGSSFVPAITTTSDAVYWRYALAAFFVDGQRTAWPYSADFSQAGMDEAYIPAWKQVYTYPTSVTSEFTLYDPYRKGYTFLGWYTNADFSGEKVTTVNSETTGTLYAKWIDDTWVIKYTSTDGNIVTPYATDVFGANIVSNIYENGVGTITFDGPVTSIGEEAFRQCSSIASITIPKSVTSIGQFAFGFCSSLTSITIPENVTSIVRGTFQGCSSIVSIVVDNNNTMYDSRNDCNAIIETATNVLVTGCKNTIIPNGITTIDRWAFASNKSLASITIPNTVMTIADHAFHSCSSLPFISIPNSVTTIGVQAFYNCSLFSSFTIPKSVTTIGKMAFKDCTSLDTIYVEATTPPTLGENVLGYSPVFTSSPLCYLPCGTLAAYEVSDWASQVGGFVEDCVEGQQIYYTSTNDSIVTPYNVNAFDANIVSNIYENGVGTITFDGPVTSIGNDAFYDCDGLISITIPNSVTSIGGFAFGACSSITSITIPNSVVSIKNSAFAYCSSLISISIPSSVTSIGERICEGCSSLISIVVEEINKIYDSRMNCNAIIETATNTLVAGCQNTIIPHSVMSIGDAAFSECSSLNSIIIPNSVTTLGCSAFYGCVSLTSIGIPSSITKIGVSAFSGCYYLDTIYVEAINPPSLGAYIFYGNPSPVCVIPCGTLAAYEVSDWASQVGSFVEDCVEGQQIYYTSTDGNIVTPTQADVFGANIVSNTYKDGQGVITFDGPVTSIGDSAFYYCTSLASITIPESVTSIGEEAFWSCESLTSITIPKSVTSIGAYAFSNCRSLTSITIPNSVTSIGEAAFSRCSSLTSVTIPESVTSIGYHAFFDCESLTSITIPESVTSIGEEAFAACSSLTSIVVEPGNTTYDSRENCNAIIETATNTLIAGCQNTVIPNTVTSIGNLAFFYCKSLTSATIGSGVTSIGNRAFEGCSSLASITIPNSVTSIGENAFSGCTSLTSVTLGSGVTSIRFATFSRCSSLTSVTLGSGVTSIEVWAFGDCTALTSITCEAITPPALDTNVFTSSPICYIPCGTKSAYEASDWASQVGEFVEEGCAPIQICGDDLYWEYADGVLTITGTGDMYDYAADTDVPWYDVRGNIKTVSLPDAMTKIGQNAFYKCTAMTTINMPTSLTAIGEKAFAQDTKLACEIILPASMTTIASRAFFNCQAVTAFHIEATTPPTIPNDAFERTTAPIHVPCGYGHIYGKHAQWGVLNLEMCESLQDNVYYYPIDGHTARAVTYHSNPTDTIVIPSAVVIDGMPRTVTEVADFAFADCKDIPAIIFNEGLEYIGERAFVRCYGLQGTIVLPATLETIGERAFSYCDNVEKYLIQAMTPPALGDGAFTCANHDALFYVSCEVMDDYKVAARWSSLKSRLRDACLNIYHYNTALGANGVHTTEDTLVASIYYRRQFTPYRWETLYLPFEVDRVTVLEDGLEYDLTAWDIVYGGHYFLAKPDGMLNKEILFGFTDELESHTPYIIQFSDAYYTDKLITFYGKESWNKLSTSFEVLSSSSWMQIAGNTTLQDQLLEKPVYMLRSGLDFILQKTTTTLHPFECYVMPYATPSGAPARMNVRFRGDVPTTVESVKGNESHLTYTVDGYTLTVYPQGQAFSIYSLNGALIYSCEAGKEAVDCELNSGCYLLHAGTEAHKIML